MQELTSQQIAFFDTFGYLGLPGLLADRIGDVIEDFEALFEAHGGGHAGHRHDGTRRSCIVPFIDQSEKLSALLDDPRILAIAKSLLGNDFNYMGSDGNYYVGDTGWHSDGWHPKHRHIKIAFYLDRVTRDTGCLRVIPGSHKTADRFAAQLQEHNGSAMRSWGVEPRDVPAIALETEPGDILVFNHNLKHAAFGGGARRRMFTINLCERYADQDLHDLRNYVEGFARFWVDSVYSESMVRNADSERMTHLEQILANQDHLADLSRRARETMAEPSRG